MQKQINSTKIIQIQSMHTKKTMYNIAVINNIQLGI